MVVWTRKNNLTINPIKSQAMIVSPSLSKSNFAITIKLNSSILQVSNNINYLGLIIAWNVAIDVAIYIDKTLFDKKGSSLEKGCLGKL